MKSQNITNLVPIEHLGYFIGYMTDATFPATSSVDELNIRVDVGPATPASCDDGVGYHGYLFLSEEKSGITCYIK